MSDNSPFELTPATFVLSVKATNLCARPPNSWSCYLFGGDKSYSMIELTMQDNKRPNAWVRLWMKVFFGTRWEKNDGQ